MFKIGRHTHQVGFKVYEREALLASHNKVLIQGGPVNPEMLGKS